MENCKTLREVCELLNISRRAVQGYEKAGIIAPSGKNKYGYLLYDEKTVERIGFVKFLQTMGFPLTEIARFIDADSCTVKAKITRQRDVLRKKIENLEDIIEKSEKYCK